MILTYHSTQRWFITRWRGWFSQYLFTFPDSVKWRNSICLHIFVLEDWLGMKSRLGAAADELQLLLMRVAGGYVWNMYFLVADELSNNQQKQSVVRAGCSGVASVQHLICSWLWHNIDQIMSHWSSETIECCWHCSTPATGGDSPFLHHHSHCQDERPASPCLPPPLLIPVMGEQGGLILQHSHHTHTFLSMILCLPCNNLNHKQSYYWY